MKYTLEQRRQKDREYYAKTRSRRLALYKERYKRNPDSFKTNNKRHVLKRKYSLSLEEFERLYLLQNGRCAICDQEEVGKLLSVDHDHETGKVRGLLCCNCNRGLGIFKDDLTLLNKASDYIRAHGVTH